jgi:hypothetical protein
MISFFKIDKTKKSSGCRLFSFKYFPLRKKFDVKGSGVIMKLWLKSGVGPELRCIVLIKFSVGFLALERHIPKFSKILVDYFQ